MNFSFDSIFSYISDLLENKPLFILIVTIVLILTLYYFKRKASSGFSLAYRFHKFLFGTGLQNKKDLIHEINSIEQFNFFFNTRAISISQKKSFEKWIKKYELDFKIIGKLKNNLNMDNLKITKYSWRYLTILLAIILLIFTSSFGSAIVAIKPAGLININNTGWFWFNEQGAEEYDFFGKGDWGFTPKDCENQKSIRSTLPSKTVEVICNSFNKEKDKIYISKLIKKQRWFFGGLTFLIGVILYSMFRHAVVVLVTYEVRRMVFAKIRRYRNQRSWRHLRRDNTKNTNDPNESLKN